MTESRTSELYLQVPEDKIPSDLLTELGYRQGPTATQVRYGKQRYHAFVEEYQGVQWIKLRPIT